MYLLGQDPGRDFAGDSKYRTTVSVCDMLMKLVFLGPVPSQAVVSFGVYLFIHGPSISSGKCTQNGANVRSITNAFQSAGALGLYNIVSQVSFAVNAIPLKPLIDPWSNYTPDWGEACPFQNIFGDKFSSSVPIALSCPDLPYPPPQLLFS